LRVTFHAIDRFREHHPEATEEDLLLALEAGEPLDTTLARALMARRAEGGAPGDHYILAPDKRGIMVVSFDQVVVTYTRLPKQSRIIMGETSTPPKEPKERVLPTKKMLQAEVQALLLGAFPGCQQVCIAQDRNRQFWLGIRDRLRRQIEAGQTDLRIEIGDRQFRVLRRNNKVVLRALVSCSDDEGEA